jgi:hypothetical protein
MTLQEASRKFIVAGLDQSALTTQEDAFATCMSFLAGVARIKGQNRHHTSYGLKHIVEHPGGHFGIPSSAGGYHGYIYEGTFILAALASGFTPAQPGKHLKATFNMSERDLKRRAKEFATEVV